MNDFDDDRLRAELNRRSGRGVSTTSAHQAVLERSGRVRRRRAVVGSGALVVLVVGGLLVLPRGDGDTLAPADSGQPIPSVADSLDDGTSELAATTTTPAATSGTPTSSEAGPTPTVDDDTDAPGPGPAPSPAPTPVTVTPPPGSTTLPAAAPTTAATPTTVTPSTVTPSTVTPSTTEAASSTTSSPTTTPPSVAPFTRTYDSLGGSITVDWDGDAFTLLSVAPAAGFDAEIEDQEPTRIRVRFRGEDDDSRIETRVDNGQLTVDIS